jgi:Protein of unknown function (DUF4199)
MVRQHSLKTAMKKTVLTFGLISGAISSLMMLATVPFMDKIGHGTGGYIVGYTGIVLSFLLVFFGIRSYRDNVGNGQIAFTKAFAVGICITLISCIFYVVTWEIIYFNFMHDFMDKYGAHVIEKLKASGASDAAVQAQVQKLKHFKELYEKPLFNAAMTFIEPFPIGLAITLISAGVLRRKSESQPAQAPLPVSH